VIGGWGKELEFMVEGMYFYVPDNEMCQTALAGSTYAFSAAMVIKSQVNNRYSNTLVIVC
jgi:hypothetical protein